MEKLLRHPKLIVASISIITVFFALQLFNIELDNNNFRFVPAEDETRLTSVYIDDTFGSSLFILVGLEREYGSIFDAQFLHLIQQYIKKIEEIEVVGDINSIMSTDYITGSSDSIDVDSLVSEDFLGTDEEIAELKSRLLSWNMYERALISDDFTATQIYIPINATVENAGSPEVVKSFLVIRDLAYETFEGHATVYVAGMPVLSATVNEAISADLKLLIPIVIAVLLIIVFIPLKDIGLVFLSLLGVLIAVIWSIGAMPILGVKMSVITTVIPVVLIAVGNSYGLHVIIHYMEGAGRDFTNMSREEHTDFIIRLMYKVINPIFLASLTTLVSFISFCFTKVIPIREFGAFAAFGVFSSFIVVILLVPAILILRGPKPFSFSKKQKKESSTQQKLNDSIADFMYDVVQKKRTIIFITIAVSIISVFGALNLIIDNVFVEYFKADSDVVKSDKFIREKFGGSKILSVMVEAESSEIILHPDTLKAMDDLNEYLVENMPEVGKVMGFTDLIKRINQIFNVDESPQGLAVRESYELSDGAEVWDGWESWDEGDGEWDSWGFEDSDFIEDGDFVYEDSFDFESGNDLSADELLRLLVNAGAARRSMNASELLWELKKLTNYEGSAYYEIPYSLSKYGKKSKEELQKIVSEYLVLLSSDIKEYANDPLEPTAIKTTVQLRTIGQVDTDNVIASINRYIEKNFPDNVTVIVGGTAAVEGALNTRIVNSLWTAIAIAFASLFLIISLVNRSFIAGLISIIPLSILVVVNIGIMGFAQIKLNIGTALISSLTLGIGIDYTIHFLEAYKHEYRTRNAAFLKAAYRTSGLAVITDAVSTGLGFAVLILSNFTMLGSFGLLTAISILLSSLVGLIVVPVLLLVFKPRFISGRASPAPINSGDVS